MQNQWFYGLVSVALAAGAALPATAQSTSVAYANPRSDYVVFLERNAGLSPVASNTVSQAADAARSARTVTIAGRRDYAEVVKRQMVQDGIPASAIVVTPKVADQLPNPADGLSDPANRRVEISF